MRNRCVHALRGTLVGWSRKEKDVQLRGAVKLKGTVQKRVRLRKVVWEIRGARLVKGTTRNLDQDILRVKLYKQVISSCNH